MTLTRLVLGLAAAVAVFALTACSGEQVPAGSDDPYAGFPPCGKAPAAAEAAKAGAESTRGGEAEHVRAGVDELTDEASRVLERIGERLSTRDPDRREDSLIDYRDEGVALG